MSWDLTAFDLPEDVVSLRTLAADFKLKSLGNRNEWIERVQRIVPGMQLQATGSIIFGYYATDDFRVQIGFGHDETIDSIAFHVYGGSEGIKFAVEVTKALNLAPFDMQTCERFSAAGSAESFRQWQQAVDRYKEQEETKD
jgi:hypothetical protein